MSSLHVLLMAALLHTWGSWSFRLIAWKRGKTRQITERNKPFSARHITSLQTKDRNKDGLIENLRPGKLQWIKLATQKYMLSICIQTQAITGLNLSSDKDTHLILRWGVKSNTGQGNGIFCAGHYSNCSWGEVVDDGRGSVWAIWYYTWQPHVIQQSRVHNVGIMHVW